jgi:uncharacterized protein (TIGR03435 family)
MGPFRERILVSTVILTAAAVPLLSQAQKTAFDVASVKLGDPNDRHVGLHTQAGGRFNTDNTPLRFLIQYAFGVNDYQISGGPSWTGSAPFTIEAKPATAIAVNTPDGNEKIKLMLQSLLADRFKLATHWETREGAVYELVIAKSGPKLSLTDPSYHSHDLDGGSGRLTGKGVPVSQHIGSLSRQLGRPIIDKTGLPGNYDFTLSYTPEERDPIFGRPVSAEAAAAPDPNVTSMFSALQEQLGLKLESAKGPIKLLVIDHAEKPSGN